MTDRELRRALLNKLKVSPQRLHQRVQALQRRSPMSTEDATYCIAFKEGIRLDKYLSRDVIDRVRSLIQHVSNGSQASSSKVKTKTIVRTREIRFGGEIMSDPILPEAVLTDAREMAGKVYPILYVFENSVREVILRVLTHAVGPDWWERVAPVPVRKSVEQRKAKENEEAWHGKRGAHSIYYADIEDLIKIVRETNAWKALAPIFGKQDWFNNLIGSIASSRNIIAHMNPLRDKDIARLKVNFSDWQAQIKARRALIP